MELTFLKKPSTEKITAVQWTGINKDEVIDFCDEAALIRIESEIGEYFGFSIPTHEGPVIAKPGDYIVKFNNKKHHFSVWTEEKLNELYFSADNIDKAFSEIEKISVSEKLERLNKFISDPSKKAPFKQLDPTEQGLICSEKEILESYLRVIITHAAYKYGTEDEPVKFYNRSNLLHTIKFIPGLSYLLKLTKFPGKGILEMFVVIQGIEMSIAKATRYEDTVNELVNDLTEFLDFEPELSIPELFGMTEEDLASLPLSSSEDPEKKEFVYVPDGSAFDNISPRIIEQLRNIGIDLILDNNNVPVGFNVIVDGQSEPVVTGEAWLNGTQPDETDLNWVRR